MDKKIEKNCRNRIWGFLVVLLFILPLAVGADEIIIQGEQAASAERRPPLESLRTAGKTAKEKLRTRVTISSTDTPIEKVLMDLADQANIDIIKSPRVTGNVTVKVTDIPLEEALTNILTAYNFTYITTENMIRVVSLPEMSDVKEPQVTRVYQITYADVEEVHAALDKFISGKGEIGINKGTSHIIVTDTEDKMKALDKFIEQVDVMTSQVLVEVRIYDVTTNEGFKLSPQWHVGRNAPYTADTILLPADEVTETEVGPERTTFTETGMDQPQQFIFPWPLPATWEDLQERTKTSLDRSGWDLGRTETEAVYDRPPLIMTNWRRREFVGGSFDRITGGTLSFSVLNDAIDVDLALTILHSQVEARLLANPRILVLDNETAEFEIVREIPYRELRQIAREDPITFTDFKKVGVDLKVTPHIARDGMMRLKIEPEFSVLVGQNMYGAPTVDVRRVDTTAMIKDGQTLVIGGLRKRQVTKDIARVPVLSDIPLVGGLFKSETESVAINELVIFITTTIITEPTLSESEQKLLGETRFTTPRLEKTRIEKGEFKKPKIEKGESEKTEIEKRDIAETLDLLLKKLGPSSKTNE